MTQLLVGTAILVGTIVLLGSIVVAQLPQNIFLAFAQAGAYMSFADRFLPVHELAYMFWPIVAFLGAHFAFIIVGIVMSAFKRS